MNCAHPVDLRVNYAQPVDLLTSESSDTTTYSTSSSQESTQIENYAPPEKPPPPRPPLPVGYYCSLPRKVNGQPSMAPEDLCPVQRSASFSYFAKQADPPHRTSSGVVIPAYPTPFDRYIARQIPAYGSIS